MLNTNQKNDSSQVCLITGPTSGLGRGLALELAQRGYQLVLLGRNKAKLEELSRECTAKGAPQPMLLVADMASQQQVRRAAKEFLASGLPLHVLVNNAGLINKTRKITEDGLEETMAISYWSAFLLTVMLSERLAQSAPAQIINITTGVYGIGRINFDDFNMDKGFLFIKAYANTKVAVMYMTRTLSRLLKDKGVRVNMYNPGMVHTNLAAGNNSGALVTFVNALWGKFTVPLLTGIQAPLRLITDTSALWKNANNVLFWENKPAPVKYHATDDGIGRLLWHVSEEKTGVQWPFTEDRNKI